MDVFVSWSKGLSHSVALRMKTWLRLFFGPSMNLFVSSEDIDSGVAWFSAVRHQLDNCHVGIICLTRDNLHSDWLLFEAGAIAKHLECGRVCTLLVDLAPTELQGPLSQFQITNFTKSDVNRLVRTLNRALPEGTRRSDSELQELFERLWPELQDFVNHAVQEHSASNMYGDEVVRDLLLPLIHRELSRCNLSDVLDWFDLYRSEDRLPSHPEVKLVEAVLARICGRRSAATLLEKYPLQNVYLKDRAAFELALLWYAKQLPVDETSLEGMDISSTSTSHRKLWASLMAMFYLRRDDLSCAHQYYELAEPNNIRENPIDAYAASHLAILALAFGNARLAERYLDIAKNIRQLYGHSQNGYPYVALIARHERAFVNTILGVNEMVLDDEWIRMARGHSHVAATNAKVLRLCDPALDTMVEMSQVWTRPVMKEQLRLRLKQFETKLLSKAGSVFID
jgi:hypothetical protein